MTEKKAKTPMSKITVEDYFAAEAMQAIIIATTKNTDANFNHYACAVLSYEIAKAMMEVRTGKQFQFTPAKDPNDIDLSAEGIASSKDINLI